MQLEDAGVAKVSRSEAKTLNFSLLYGGTKTLQKYTARDLQITKKLFKLYEKELKAKARRFKGHPCICGQVYDKHSNTKCGHKGRGMGFYVPMDNFNYIKWKVNPHHRVMIKTVSDL
jgi:hypothetical protein